MLSCQTFQAPRHILEFLGQRELSLPALLGRCLSLRAHSPLHLFLLPPGQLAQLLHGFIDQRLRRSLLLPALHRLVLVPQLVHFQLEQIRQILEARVGATTAAVLAGKRHRHLTEYRVRALQVG